ncbi:MAG: CDP-alcohol phosphatidyltransferase family protein [Candidatus Nealsonbacteria bacterium]|nr:CDP-alcohol phosphatidyltransferase family protein [Candidatus Nealsonbacteria bacterium]
MKRIPLDELERRCQKPDHRQVGNWMARHVSRPAALRITQVVARWGVSANMATVAAWALGIAATAALAWGTVWAWIIGAVALQLWYLLDHVDGQLARLHGTASLDGVQLDYLMHHTINLLVPLGAGWGVYRQLGEPLWMAAGLLWGVSLLMLTMHHDARYKAFVKRLKRLRGRLDVVGGGGGRPEPQPAVPRSPMRLIAWFARKACEMHVAINAIAVIALGQLITADVNLLAGRIYLAVIAPTAAATAAWTVFRSQQQGTAEREFAAWYRVPPQSELIFSDGWWIVQPAEDGQDGDGLEQESS